MELKGISAKERCQVLEEAVKLTVPGVDNKPISQPVLSIQELNLILEYQAHKHPEKLQELCLQLLSYMEEKDFDLAGRVMFRAKAALFYCNAMHLEEKQKAETKVTLPELEQALTICTEGIEALRDCQKIYFAWELLQKKEQYITLILTYSNTFSAEKAEAYQKELEQTKEFFHLLDGMYEEFQVPKKTNGFTVFYREHENYCINDVDRARRRMLGISRAELEKTILGKSTLKRIEKKETNPQMGNARKLFDRLNLSAEMHRAQIITDSRKAIQLENDFRMVLTQREFENAKDILNKLKLWIPQDNRINQQYLYFFETLIAYQKGEMEKEDFIQCAKDALELTIPLSAAMKKMKEERTRNGKIWPSEKYLTNMEVTILTNIAIVKGSNVENEYWEVLKEYFEWLEKKCTLAPIMGMYGFVMTSVASWMGNLGQYEESSMINRKILRELLRARSFSYTYRNMYGLMWNEQKQKGLPTDKEDPEWRKNLWSCYTVNVYCKNKWAASKVLKRLGITELS
ncbi:MAG: helix-turn-helix domain-containing protein [Lachnospiraceae bacterium]